MLINNGVVFSTLATHASGPGSIPVAGGKKREINFSSPLEVVPLVDRISRKTEVPSTLTLRVEVKEPTDDAKHSGSDHTFLKS